MRCGGPALCSECAADAYRARAALAQPFPAIATAPTYQFHSREIGESDWAPCDFSRYLYCSKSPEMDTRVVEVTAQPSPAQAEQAEAERPEVVAVVRAHGFGRVCEAIDADTLYQHCSEGEPLMTVAQHERIVGALRAEITQLRQHKNDYMDAGQETYRALQNEIKERVAEIARLDGLVSGRTAERDAALARVAELETALEPFAAVADAYDDSEDDDHEPYTDMGCDDRLRLTLGQHRAGRIALEGRTPQAQAQHSVPEGWMLVECGIWTQEQVDEMQKTVTRFRNSEFVDDRALAMAVADAGQCKAPEISLAELLAAAPGKEGV